MKVNPLNAELNPICHLLALLGAHHILHVSGIRVKDATGGGCGCLITVPEEVLNGGSVSRHHHCGWYTDS
jgi:hypothetical protein